MQVNSSTTNPNNCHKSTISIHLLPSIKFSTRSPYLRVDLNKTHYPRCVVCGQCTLITGSSSAELWKIPVKWIRYIGTWSSEYGLQHTSNNNRTKTSANVLGEIEYYNIVPSNHLIINKNTHSRTGEQHQLSWCWGSGQHVVVQSVQNRHT